MAANLTKAQVTEKFKKAGVVQPNVKLSRDELQARMGQRSVTFAHKGTKRLKTRSAQKSYAFAN